jgi:hypothetical protein
MRNERRGDIATRAVIMVDPFPNQVPVQQDYKPNKSLFGVIGAIFGSLMAQASFKADELKLARDENVFSRFFIAPTRDVTRLDGDMSERPAITSSSLSHFGGFLDEGFRRHDFLLGRRNCQRFLQQCLVLPVANPLFSEWPDHLKQPGSRYHVKRNIDGVEVDCLPIIPLVSEVAEEEPLPKWPTISEDRLDELKDGVGLRTGLVVRKLIGEFMGSKGVPRLLKAIIIVLSPILFPLIRWCLPWWLTRKIMNEIRNNLSRSGLVLS